MLRFQTSGVAPADLESAYQDAQANAPDDIRADAAVLIANARAVTAAFAAAGSSTQSVDTAQVLATLTPAQRQFAIDLASASKNGTVPPGGTGHVLSYVQSHCSSAPSGGSSSFSAVASSIN